MSRVSFYVIPEAVREQVRQEAETQIATEREAEKNALAAGRVKLHEQPVLYYNDGSSSLAREQRRTNAIQLGEPTVGIIVGLDQCRATWRCESELR